jgi:hypothetical protein
MTWGQSSDKSTTRLELEEATVLDRGAPMMDCKSTQGSASLQWLAKKKKAMKPSLGGVRSQIL